MRRVSTVYTRAALALGVSLGSLWGGHALAAPVSSAFTYQGELYDEGQPFNGEVDLRFTPYADLANPNLLGPPVVVEDVLVSAGVFTAQVDFGAGFFVGDAVFLEIAVRPGDATDPNAFEAMTPRQEITATPYAMKPAPGSVTDIELAGDAVGTAQIDDDSVASADVADASLTPADLSLASGAFDSTFWRVGGNPGTPGVLGTLDAGQSLSLVAPAGVTINGDRVNGNSELTIRGNSGASEHNADIVLWPRQSTALFALTALPTSGGTDIATPTNASLQISAVGTDPFTGFFSRARMDWDGDFGLGPINPQARLHVVRNGIGFNTPADASEAMELVVEDTDAHLGLYSDGTGAGGSVIGLAEMSSGAFVNQWGLYRGTSAVGNPLRFSFGTNNSAAANPVRFGFGADGGVALGENAVLGTTSFVFADAFSATDVAPTGENQFLVRARGGMAINDVAFADEELIIGPSGAGANPDSVNFVLGGSGTGRFRFIAGPSGVSDEIGNLQIVNSNPSFTNSQIFYLYTNGGTRRLGLFRGRADGTWVHPAHPIQVGDPVIANSGNGAHLTSGGVWTNGSSRRFKEGFAAIDAADVLSRVLDLAITRWRYRGSDDAAWHLGPVAEDFHAAFGLGGDAQYIGTVDADGVALAAIQGLAQREDARVAELQQENDELRAALATLAARVEALERAE